jgi:hypothetical protein
VSHCRRRTGHLPRAILAIWAVASISTPAALAASPSPVASPEPTPEFRFPIQFWLDRPLPVTAAAGTMITVGFTLWNTETNTLETNNSPSARLHVPGVEPPPFTARPRQDFPGHITLALPVAEGGPGSLEVGFSGQGCTDDGVCTEEVFLFPPGGVGPPPGLLPASAWDAAITPPGDSVVAGQPIELGITLSPKGNWAPDALPLPESLFVIIRQPRGADLGSVPTTPDPTNPGSYAGTLMLPSAGTFNLVASTDEAGSSGKLFVGSVIRVAAEPSTEPPPSADGGGPPVVLIGGGVAVGIGFLLLLRRILADF